MVVLTHVVEVFDVVPWMHLRLESSPGLYLDLISALLGLVAIPIGYARHTFAVQRRGLAR